MANYKKEYIFGGGLGLLLFGALVVMIVFIVLWNNCKNKLDKCKRERNSLGVKLIGCKAKLPIDPAEEYIACKMGCMELGTEDYCEGLCCKEIKNAPQCQ